MDGNISKRSPQIEPSGTPNDFKAIEELKHFMFTAKFLLESAKILKYCVLLSKAAIK